MFNNEFVLAHPRHVRDKNFIIEKVVCHGSCHLDFASPELCLKLLTLTLEAATSASDCPDWRSGFRVRLLEYTWG